MSHPKYTARIIAKTIDHSLLKPEMTREEVKAGCEIAKKYDVASVCCKPSDVKFCADLLKGTDVLVGTVVGFPHGTSTTEVKVFETKQAVADGATEIDMVINIGHLKSGMNAEVQADIKAVVDASAGHTVKVILENAYLTDEEKVTACKLSEAAGAHYVKTSTGYAPTGALLRVHRSRRSPGRRRQVSIPSQLQTPIQIPIQRQVLNHPFLKQATVRIKGCLVAELELRA